MSMKQVFEEIVKYAKETSWGDKTAPSTFARTEDGGLRVTEEQQTVDIVTNASFPYRATAVNVGGTVTATFAQTLTPGNATAWLDMGAKRTGGKLDSYCFGKSGVENRIWYGGKVGSWTLGAGNKECVKLTQNWTFAGGSAGSSYTHSAGNYTTSTPFLGYTVSCLLSTAVLSNVDSVEVRGENNLIVGPIKANKSLAWLAEGEAKNTMTIRTRKSSALAANLARAGTNVPIKIAWSNGGSKHLCLSATAVILPSAAEEGDNQAAPVNETLTVDVVTELKYGVE